MSFCTNPVTHPCENLILGLAPTGNLYYSEVSYDQVKDLLRSAIMKHRLHSMDTAPWYGCGKSELHLGNALADLVQECNKDDNNNKEKSNNNNSNDKDKIQYKIVIRDMPSAPSAGPITVRGLHIVSAAAGDNNNDNDNIHPSLHGAAMPLPEEDLVCIATKVGRITIPKDYFTNTHEEPEVEGVTQPSDDNLCQLSLSSAEYCKKVFTTHYSEEYQQLLAKRVERALHTARCAQRLFRSRGNDCGSPASGSVSPGTSTTDMSNIAKATEGHSSFALCATHCAFLDDNQQCVPERITGTLYLESLETAHLVAIYDCSYAGTLLAFAQSYERIFGALHAALGESVTVDDDGFIKIVKKDTENKKEDEKTQESSLTSSPVNCFGAAGNWFQVDTLRLHDVDTEELFRTATGMDEGSVNDAGAYAAMAQLKTRGYVQKLSVGLTNATYAQKHVKFVRGQTKIPSLRLHSALLAGCWNIAHRENEAISFFRSVLVGNDTIDHHHFELHNGGVFGAGLLWGRKVYRYAAADEVTISHREALFNIVKEVLGGDDAVAAARERTGYEHPYLLLAATALKFALTSTTAPTSKGGFCLRTKVVVGCATVQELEGCTAALEVMPTDEQMSSIMHKWKEYEAQCRTERGMMAESVMDVPIL